MFKLLFSVIILLVGVVGVAMYTLRPMFERQGTTLADDSSKPWRPLGAAIGGLIAVMFVLGIYVVDIPDHPRTYAAYWAVMLLLQFWLCLLALKDVRYTRRQLAIEARVGGLREER